MFERVSNLLALYYWAAKEFYQFMIGYQNLEKFPS